MHCGFELAWRLWNFTSFGRLMERLSCLKASKRWGLDAWTKGGNYFMQNLVKWWENQITSTRRLWKGSLGKKTAKILRHTEKEEKENFRSSFINKSCLYPHPFSFSFNFTVEAIEALIFPKRLHHLSTFQFYGTFNFHSSIFILS